MEQPPGSLEDLQPQNISSFPTVINLTQKGEECVLNATSFNALQMVTSPSCYPISGTSNPGLPFPVSGSSDIALPPGDQIQPDDAFSHTTVTLSYVSRSHVFSTHESLSRHSPVYSMPPVSKFSLHPPSDSDKGLGDTGYTLNQHYLEQAEGSVDLASQTELLQSLPQAQVQPENDGGVCLAEELHQSNGVLSVDGDIETDVEEERGHSALKCKGLENGQQNSWSSPGVCAESSPETLTTVTGEDEDRGSSEVQFISSKEQDPAVIKDGMGARDLCSLSREYISPLEDPVSPSATSLADVEEVFDLPQTSSSPSANNSYLETAEDATWDGQSTEGAIQAGPGIGGSLTRLDSSNENTQSVCRQKAEIEPLIDLTNDVCVSDVLEEKSNTAIPHMNGKTKALQRTLKVKKLPVRSGRGMRLEAIVMNINSSRYKVSGCIRTNKKASASQSSVGYGSLTSSKRNDTLSPKRRKSRAMAASSVTTVKQKAGTQTKRTKTDDVNTDSCKDSTSDSPILSNSKRSHLSTPPKSPRFAVCKWSKTGPENGSTPLPSPQTSPPESKSETQSSPHKNPGKDPELLSSPEPSVVNTVARVSPTPSPPPPSSSPSSKSPKRSRGKAKTAGIKASPTAKMKAARVPKRRRKKYKCSPSPMFSPREPEIKLKYVNYKEEKRDSRLDSFSPFIRVEAQQSSPSCCTIINYPEEATVQHKKGQHPHSFISAVVPSTSCLQLGRVSTHSQHQRSLVCCLCGSSANAMDLGDLHGPYYPEGYQPSTKTPALALGLKEEEDDYSDSDSSCCIVRRVRGRKCAAPLPQWPLRRGAQLKQKGFLGSHRWSSNRTGSPAAKRARTNSSPADTEDWYSPPMLPLEPCEYWLHEDCGVWSAGVFLVKGKVYGLEEAVRVAQETTCSACREPGATLGCFFKSCPNKYHYRCALESDCVLIEENFSMKCKKHKNKTFKAPPGNRSETR